MKKMFAITTVVSACVSSALLVATTRTFAADDVIRVVN
jgi:hypothetical protein